MTFPFRFLRSLLTPRGLYILAWLLALGIGAGRIINARLAYNELLPPGDPNRRVDGNHGHTSIDFAGQWLMGRMLTSGHGKDLYRRPVQREVAHRAFPREAEAPNSTSRDADKLLSWFVGHDEGEAIGGPLYPPIHVFVMAPFALDDHPQAAYFAMQWVQFCLCVFAGLGVSVLSRGRIWWPVALALILAFPGCKGVIDLGQNSALSLVLLIWGWAARVHGRPILGGLIWGFLAYKPVWAVSFFFALLALQQWRMAIAMAIGGAGISLLTIPFVGVHSWLHWLQVGEYASKMYNVDGNWIPLSRDILGIPRRLLIDFSLSYYERENFLARLLSWALWLLIIEVTLRTLFAQPRQPISLIGPLPGMVFLTAWMCTYHFMYYDALISCFAICVLLADPQPWFTRKELYIEPRAVHSEITGARREQIFLNSFVLTVLVMMLLHENTTRMLKLEWTGVMKDNVSVQTLPNETTELRPRLILGTGDGYPWETLGIALIWLWCVFHIALSRNESGPQINGRSGGDLVPDRCPAPASTIPPPAQP